MNRALLKHALVVSAASLIATSAFAQSPNANPQGQAHAAEPAKAATAPGAKADDKGSKDKADDKAKGAKAEEKADKKDGKEGDRVARKAKEHEEQKAKLGTMLKGPMDEPVKQELRHHAERLARIERIKSLAEGAKDTDAVDRATKLAAKENARHDKWMTKHVATPSATTGAAAVPAPAAQPDSKGGAK